VLAGGAHRLEASMTVRPGGVASQTASSAGGGDAGGGINIGGIRDISGGEGG